MIAMLWIIAFGWIFFAVMAAVEAGFARLDSDKEAKYEQAD